MTQTKLEQREETAVVVAGLTRDQVGVIKRTVCAGYSDDELRLYMFQCQQLGLDPLARETYTFKAGGKVIIGISIDGFRRRADETGCYAPGRPTEYGHDDKGKLEYARVYVKKRVGDEWHEVSEDAYYSEYKGSSPNWGTMPRVMLSKCAEARALRRCFPAKFTGIYAPEERAAIERNSPQSTRATRGVDMFRAGVRAGIDASDAIEATAEGAPDAPQDDGETFEGDTPYALAIRAAHEMGATDGEIDQAMAEAGITALSADWTAEHGDLLLSALERIKGA